MGERAADTIDWLLSSELAIRLLTRRDLLDELRLFAVLAVRVR
jgi:hypothetical protein